MQTLLKLTLLGCALAAIGCSGGRNPDKEPASSPEKTTQIANVEFEILPNASLVTSANETAGTGILSAREALPGVEIGRHFTIRGQLNEGGSIRLIAFASRDNAELKHGFEIELAQASGQPGLKVIATASGSTHDWSTFFSALNPLTEFDLGFDVHNDETGEAHILIWNLKDSTRQEAIFDSSKDVSGSPGKGFGRIWGIQLKDASVRSVTVGDVRNDH